MAAKSKSKNKTRKRSTGVDQKLVKALSHQLRAEILTILNERMASPNELSKELEEGLSQVSYHVKVLKDFECIEMVKTEPRRGAVEHYYRATSRAYLTDRDWRTLPESVKAGVSTAAFQAIVDDVSGAMEGGTFDSRDDRHVSWTPGVVDQQGWDESVDLINKTLKQLMTIHSGSNKRLAKSGEEGVHITTILMNFETLSPEARKSPKATKKRKAKKAAKKV